MFWADAFRSLAYLRPGKRHGYEFKGDRSRATGFPQSRENNSPFMFYNVYYSELEVQVFRGMKEN